MKVKEMLDAKKKDAEEEKKIKVEGDGGMTVCLSADGTLDSLTTSDYTTTNTGSGCSTIEYKIQCVLTLNNSATLAVEQPEVTSIEEDEGDRKWSDALV